MPTERKRGTLRWWLLFFHAVLFAVVVFAYPSLIENDPVRFTDSNLWLALTAWGVLIVAHLVVVALLDMMEGVRRTRRDRIRRREYEQQRRTQSRHTLQTEGFSTED